MSTPQKSYTFAQKLPFFVDVGTQSWLCKEIDGEMKKVR